MKSIQVLVRESTIQSVDKMSEKQQVIFGAIGKSLETHAYGDVVSLAKILTTYSSGSKKIEKLNLNSFCSVKDVQSVIDYIYHVQTIGKICVVPVIIGTLENDTKLSSITIKYEYRENVQLTKEKKVTKKKLLSLDKVAEKVATLCNDNQINLDDLFACLSTIDTTETTKEETREEKIA